MATKAKAGKGKGASAPAVRRRRSKRQLPPAAERAMVPSALRAAKAVECRAMGMKYREIAEALKRLPPEEREKLHVTDSYCEAWAYRDVINEVDRVRAETKLVAEQILEVEREGLRVVRARLFTRFLGTKDAPGETALADQLLKVHDRVMRLEGLDKARKVEVTGAGGGPVEVEGEINADALAEAIAQLVTQLSTPATAEDGSP